jgi:hypothetical protein
MFKVTYKIFPKSCCIYVNGLVHLYIKDKTILLGFVNYYEDLLEHCIELQYTTTKEKTTLIYDSDKKWKKITKCLRKMISKI